jgi:hypothetical protein
MRKRFSGGELTAKEQQTFQQVMRSFGAGGGGGPGGFAGGRPRAGGTDFQFGGNYIVFVMREGGPTPVMVRTGLTDLDYSEVVSGLDPRDSVLILPSASLVQQQEEWRERTAAMSGGALPGMRRDTTAAASTRPGGGRP